MSSHIWAVFKPNEVVSKTTMRLVLLAWAVIAALAWSLYPSGFIPKPWTVIGALKELWLHDGLGQALWASFMLNLEALAITSIVSLSLAYFTVVPAMRPVVAFLSRMRFLGLAGLTVFFTWTIGGGHTLKLWLVVFGMTVYFVTSMADEVASIPKDRLDHARTLRMGEWRVVWETIVLGKMDAAIEVLRQNAAIGWMMISMVEGIVRSEGGVGALLLSNDKHFHLDKVIAIQMVILVVALLQDYGFGIVKKVLCPHASLTLERK